jgi:hypothetical protein
MIPPRRTREGQVGKSQAKQAESHLSTPSLFIFAISQISAGLASYRHIAGYFTRIPHMNLIDLPEHRKDPDENSDPCFHPSPIARFDRHLQLSA